MKKLIQYIIETLGAEILVNPLLRSKIGKLPLFLSETYNLSEAKILNLPFIIVERRNPDELSILQTEKHFKIIKDTFDTKVVLLANNLASYNRKRLIEKGINFIVPGKQLFLPDLLIDLRETLSPRRETGKKQTLLPSAQLLVLYRILNKENILRIENIPFKQLAEIFHYTPMVITNAADNLRLHEICTTEGSKERSIRFNLDIPEMWNDLVKRNLLINPVLKRVFVDEKPENLFLLHSNTSALPEYSDMNPSRQEFFAIDRKAFYDLQKNNRLSNANKSEGNYCLEVWKYDPLNLIGGILNEKIAVDPLSLFLCLKNDHDERIQDALEQIIKKYIW
jgi:hypothetical protein